MDYFEIQTEIMHRFWQCNELSKKQAETYAAIAVDVFKKSQPQETVGG